MENTDISVLSIPEYGKIICQAHKIALRQIYRALSYFAASRILCYSCMSPYLEHQYMYISHLYRRPMSFTSKCDQSSFN
ncbi:hypothetical protein X798_05783 [Onchocerca flexuosa]|uniref:Uncharacterized protein n=1 Tax=Onchocerca flexuosa TaxID=387005 RepID=A0A238BRB8_9BILA|nr:hypothetical protein X798_05783 [Onchocerca flexuosa]